MTKSQKLIIMQNSYMYKDNIAFMNLQDCTYPYQIFEIILTNVAAKENKTWKDLYFATEQTPFLLISLMVALILIRHNLKEVFELNEKEVSELLGIEHYSLIAEFY